MSNNFLQQKAIKLLGGDQSKSASSALRAHVGHLCWGHHLPAEEGEEPSALPSKIFYAIEDRTLADSEYESTDDRILINQVRKRMVIHEGVLLKKLSIVIFVALLVLGALSKVLYTEGQKHRGISQVQTEQQDEPSAKDYAAILRQMNMEK